MFDSGVVPKCAVYGAILDVLFGMSFIPFLISATLSASVICFDVVSLFRTDRPLLLFE